MRSVLLAAAALALVAPGSAAADRRIVEHRVQGPVAATFSYVKTGVFPSFTSPRLTIKLDGRVVVDRLPPHCPSCELWPLSEGSALAIADLDGDGIPEVTLATYRGGAHCCTVLYVYRRVGSSYVPSSHDFASEGYRDDDLDGDGHRDYVTGDPRFEYLFTSYAESFEPVQVLSYRDGRFVDTTRRFPERIRADARLAWTLYLREQGKRDVRGLLAAWAADKVMLHEGDDVWPALDRAAAAGHLDGPGAPAGAAFPAALRRTLTKFGYIRTR